MNDSHDDKTKTAEGDIAAILERLRHALGCDGSRRLGRCGNDGRRQWDDCDATDDQVSSALCGGQIRVRDESEDPQTRRWRWYHNVDYATVALYDALVDGWLPRGALYDALNRPFPLHGRKLLDAL